ncbi:hypothetical protein D9619_006647 [Psilocybe cf. subviscida]|uniref:Uncharacterized protein n=1 Tax=Psilocybe cf. subviscida TaxID=2480587 RepID=A0A8H5B4P8_9AGAR|nr:hypothetical protein D9619_006647 [Psilocybe cf. subviscida]
MFDLVPPHQHINHPAAVFDKAPTTNNIYLRQSNAAPTHAVIQLVEVSPPPRRIASVIRAHDDSLASSSYESGSSYYSSSYESEGMDLDEEEEVGESYCSSDDEQQEPEVVAPAPEMTSEDQEAFARRMKRILVWRELTVSASSEISTSASSSTSQLLLPSAPASLKRSASSVADECDAPSSKRSRCAPSSVASDACPPSLAFSSSSSTSSCAPVSVASSLRRSISPAELSMPSCTACDAFFPTVDAFRAHAHASREACGAAVEYALEH